MADEVVLRELQARGIAGPVADACATLFSSATEAMKYVDREVTVRNPWKEYYSRKYQRFYYCNDNVGYNNWEMPPQMLLQEWMLDADLYRMPITQARDISRALHGLLAECWHVPDALWECVGLLAKVVGNVVTCGNTLEKYRCIKTDNPKVRDKVLALPGATDVLRAAGFEPARSGSPTINFPANASPERMSAATLQQRHRSGSPTINLPANASPERMASATLVAAKLQQLADRRGFTGSATAVDDDRDGSSRGPAQTKWHGQQGFRYQQEIYECSACGHPINDGSERLFTRSHDAPKGEFRYECQSCRDPAFNLCEGCWDKMLGNGGPAGTSSTTGSAGSGAVRHDPGHTFRTHYPRESRHNMYAQETDSNPWGVALGRGASAARARERLKDRTGM